MLAFGLVSLVTLPARADPASTDPASTDTAGADDYINPDRPGIADGSTVIFPSRFEIETGIQAEYRSHGEEHDRTLFLPSLLRIGVNKNWEIRIEGNAYTWVSTYDPLLGSMHDEGASPVSIGAKVHFVDSAGIQQPSVGAILRIFPASGSGSFRTTHVTGDFRLVADWDIASQWSLNPNVGVGVYEGDANRVYTAGLFAMTLNYNPSKTLNFFVDTGVQSPETNHGKTSVIFDAGVAYLITRDIQLDFSAG
ncbi:MAG TPA: transporter, partial [Xanthomonadaceae bacterium]|nr:transporter [Xanthomonadaceae bacterium]